MQADGNLVLYDSKSKPLWDTQTSGKGTAPYSVVLQNDGNLALYEATQKVLWSIKPVSSLPLPGPNPAPPTYSQTGTHILTQGGKMFQGQELISMNKAFHALLLTDGNLIVYKGPYYSKPAEIYNSNINKTNVYPPFYLIMQSDGKLSIYDCQGTLAWDAKTLEKGKAPFRLELGDDGGLAVIDGNNSKTWSSTMQMPSPYPSPSPFPLPSPFPTPSPYSPSLSYPTPSPFPFPSPFPSLYPSPKPFSSPSQFPSQSPSPIPPPSSFPMIPKGLAYLVSIHSHPLILAKSKSGWLCDGKKGYSGCQTTHINIDSKRYHCPFDSCNYDLCEPCVLKYNSNMKPPLWQTSVHPHLLVECKKSTRWNCDGQKSGLPGPHDTNSSEAKRYRCINEGCDFDLCKVCMSQTGSLI